MSSRFVRMGDLIINVDDVSTVVDDGKYRRIYMRGEDESLGIDTSKTIDELLYILNDKEPSYDWIPCRERLPKSGEQVFAYLFGDSPYIAWYNDRDGKWHTDDFTLNADEEPKEWLPLPMPKKGVR